MIADPQNISAMALNGETQREIENLQARVSYLESAIARAAHELSTNKFHMPQEQQQRIASELRGTL